MLTCFKIAIFALIASCSMTSFAQAQGQHHISMAIGEPGSDSFVFGTELWAMGQIALKPQYGIDLASIEVVDESERLASLEASEVEIALVGGNLTSSSPAMRTVLALWPEATAEGKGKQAQILAHKDVADDVIYRITRAIFENTNFFNGTKEKFGEMAFDLGSDKADLPIHPGASRYYQEKGISPNAALTHLATAVNTETFENFDDQGLNDEERAQVAAACRQALDQGALSAVLGDLSSKGCEVYQDYLEQQAGVQQQAMSTGTEQLIPPSGQGEPSGQGGPAIALENVQGKDRRAVSPLPEVRQQSLMSNPRQPTM